MLSSEKDKNVRVHERAQRASPGAAACVRESGFVVHTSTLTWLFSGVKQEEGPPITPRINICLKAKSKSSHWDHTSVLLGTGVESPCSEEHLI